VATGTPLFGSFSGGPFDPINNGNLNVNFSIPVVNKAGRGLPFNYNLTYDTSVWYPVSSGVTTSWQPVTNWGWSPWTAPESGYLYFSQQTSYCSFWTGYNWVQAPYEVVLSGFIYYDQGGTPHPFPGEDDIWSNPGHGCPSGTTTYDTNAIATDGSGYIWNGQTWTVTPPNGGAFNPPSQAITGASSTSDANGNTISNTNNGVYTDTLGVTALSVSGSGTPSSPVTFQYAGAGGSATVTVKYTSFTVATNFGASGISEYGRSAQNLVTEIDLPDQNQHPTDKYTITYEATPATPSSGACTPLSGTYQTNCVTARIATITLPTGGEIQYGYSGGSNGILSDGSTATLTRTTPDGTWTYAHTENGTAWTTDITAPADPQGNQAYTVMNFQGIYPTERKVYATNGGTQLLDVTTCYGTPTSYTEGVCNSWAIQPPLTVRFVLTTPYANGSPGSMAEVVQLFSNYASYSLPYEVDEYDWGRTLSRKTITAYDYNTSCGVPSGSSVVDKPCSVTVQNSSGGTVASTTYTYDANGNLLKQTPSVGPQLQFTYNSNGTMATSNDGAGTTTCSYGSNSCNAFPDTVTPPISALATTSVWNCYGAVPTSTTDANSKTTNLGYDLMNRLTSGGYPDGGSVTVAYTPTQVQTTTKITSSVSRTDTASLDSQGRVSSKTVAGVTTNTTYDHLGRVWTVGVSGSGAQDTYQYDALSRVTQVTHADSTYVQTSYSNNCATTTDESGKVRQVCSDGLGRVNSVTEDPSGLAYQTTYGHDPLKDLTSVTQGSQSRSYQYDSLGRLTQATTPESGTIYFTYDSDSTCGTSKGDLVKRVDARGTRTCYAYDTMHRPTQKSYSDGTASANYYYDQSSYNGLTINNGKGRRTGMSDGSGQTAWNYDAMGRALTEERTIAGITATIGDTFNYDGSLASLTYPSRRTITYGVDSLGRPQSAVDSTNNINYALSATYAAQGALASVLSGKTSSFGGITYSLGYNNRLLPSSISASSSNGTALSLSYSFYGNGSPNVITNNRDNGRTVTYGYDSLNRWNSASSQATSGADCWGQSVPAPNANPPGYDRYGNLQTINVSKCSAPAPSISVNGNNQVSGFAYNAAGDVTNDGSYSYSWDAENRLTTAAGVTYTYDGDGQRVKKSSGTLYWRGSSGSVLAETDTSGNTTNEYIFFGARIARRDSSGNVYYYFGNHLGSAAITNAAGTLCYDADFYPIGGELAFTNNCSQSYKFAGMEQDSETGEYHTQFRQYTANLSRWLSPDPSGTAAVSLTNPQTWNMYAYVTNNPTTLTDATGLDGGYSGPPCGAWWICEAQYQSMGCMAGEYGCPGTPSEADIGEQEYIYDNCIGCVSFDGYTFRSFAAWADFSTSEAVWQQELDRVNNGATAAFDALFENNGRLDPNAAYKVTVTDRGFSVEDTLTGYLLNVANAEQNGINDPFSLLFHPGASWYETDFLGLFGTDVTHLVLGPNGVAMGHVDPWGPLNPLHGIIQVLGGLIGGTSQWGTLTCSYANGCHP